MKRVWWGAAWPGVGRYIPGRMGRMSTRGGGAGEVRGRHLCACVYARVCVCPLRRPGNSSTPCLQTLEPGFLGELVASHFQVEEVQDDPGTFFFQKAMKYSKNDGIGLPWWRSG